MPVRQVLCTLDSGGFHVSPLLMLNQIIDACAIRFRHGALRWDACPHPHLSKEV